MGVGGMGDGQMRDAIFLSAGVPDPRRGPQYAKTADTVAIAAAVSALVHVTLGRRLLVWGGQPAITPMIWFVADGLKVEYGQWVKLYQSNHFKDEFPEDNKRFSNVHFTKDMGDREKSLSLMREKMFSDFNFTDAVFIGGMKGIVDEFELIEKVHPAVTRIPVLSTGGAVLDLATRVPNLPPDLATDLDYVALFHRHLGISVKENRYPTPDLQPKVISQRLWQ